MPKNKEKENHQPPTEKVPRIKINHKNHQTIHNKEIKPPVSKNKNRKPTLKIRQKSSKN
ncbi:hypothetical protein HYE18_01995 [Mycoplasmopsis bovis]|nr:hypothetical protein [Mycoplasmopsis bovis]QQH25072.1 hypothetical protein HYE18_01995 [Mycoplasmopsis bovis]